MLVLALQVLNLDFAATPTTVAPPYHEQLEDAKHTHVNSRTNEVCREVVESGVWNHTHRGIEVLWSSPQDRGPFEAGLARTLKRCKLKRVEKGSGDPFGFGSLTNPPTAHIRFACSSSRNSMRQMQEMWLIGRGEVCAAIEDVHL